MTQYSQVEYLDPKKIEVHEKAPNVRSKITKGDCQDLMKSIRESGVKQPLVVWKRNGNVYLVNGERRLRSVQWINEEEPGSIKSIPVIAGEYPENEDEAIKMVMFENLIENLQRSDINGFDLALRLQDFVARGLPKDEISKAIGKSTTWINEALKFLESTAEVQKAVKDGDLTLREGIDLSKLSLETQPVVARGLIEAKQVGDKKAKRTIKRRVREVTTRSGNPSPGVKERTSAYNAAGEILKAMKDAKVKENDPEFVMVTATHLVLKWTIGKIANLNFKKFLDDYGLKLDDDGHRVVEKPEPKDEKAEKKAKGKDSKKK